MVLLSLAYHSLKNRKLTTALTVVSIALSIGLLIGVENVRVGARQSFEGTISQTDLIVGARGGSLQLLLYSVFRIGQATNNITYQSYLKFKNHPAVEWTIPYSLGDSHRGFRVVGTDENFYKHLRYRRDVLLPYTLGLLRSVPDPTVEQGKLYQIPGQPPDLAHLPPGCPFAPRCERAKDICRSEFPPYVQLTPDHHSLCHFASEVFAESADQA